MRLPLKSLLTALLVIGAALTAGLIGLERTVSHRRENEALLRQALRARDLAHPLVQGLQASEQAAHLVADAVVPEQDPVARRSLLRAVMRASAADSIMGLGVWPESLPGNGLYARREEPGRADAAVTFHEPGQGQDYRHEDWYRRARESRGAPVFLEPRLVGPSIWRVHARAFLNSEGKVLGVITVDLWLPQARERVEKLSVEDVETAFITTPGGRLFAHPEEGRLLDWARAQGLNAVELADLGLEELHRYEVARFGDSRLLASEDLTGLGWSGHVSSASSWLFAQVRREREQLVTLGLALWVALFTLPLLPRGLGTVRERFRRRKERQRPHGHLESSERTPPGGLEMPRDEIIRVEDRRRTLEGNAQAGRAFGSRKTEELGQGDPRP